MDIVYETDKDRENEKRVMREVCCAWGMTPKFTEQFSRVDAIGWRTGPVAILEVKCRKQRFETLAVSNDKIEAGILQSEKFNLPFYLIIEWPDGIHYLRVTRERILRCGYDGARSTRTPEIMAHFDPQLFHKVAIAATV